MAALHRHVATSRLLQGVWEHGHSGHGLSIDIQRLLSLRKNCQRIERLVNNMSNPEINSITAVEPIPGMPRMEIVYKPISWFKEYGRNPRKNDATVDRMCASIREFGFAVPMLCRSSAEVVDGHLRLKSSRKLGMQELPVVLCDDWTDAQVKAFRLMVNRSVTWAEFDEEKLALELQELRDLDFDLTLTGFDSRELDDLLNIADDDKADAAPPLPESPVSRLGDLWLLGDPPHQHRVLAGDATSAEAVLRLLGERKPRLMVCDPLTELSWIQNGAVARTERARTGRAELHEEANAESHRDYDFPRHSSGLV